MIPHLTDAQWTGLEHHARGLGNIVNHVTRTQLATLGLVQHGEPDGWPYWHLTTAGWRALADATNPTTDPAEPDDYHDEQADAWRDER